MAIKYQSLSVDEQRQILTEALHNYEAAHFRASLPGAGPSALPNGVEDSIIALQERLASLASPE
jgi:hypothetical protein